jgi:hypothetical protein
MSFPIDEGQTDMRRLVPLQYLEEFLYPEVRNCVEYVPLSRLMCTQIPDVAHFSPNPSRKVKSDGACPRLYPLVIHCQLFLLPHRPT